MTSRSKIDRLRQLIAPIPIIGPTVRKLSKFFFGSAPIPMSFTSSTQYWRDRYALGGNSGSGSYGRLAKFTIVGSFVEATLPAELFKFIKDGICLDPRNSIPMEMDAYSIYLALRSVEERHNCSYHTERIALVNAVLNREEICGGFWAHPVWTKSAEEIHMRFTAAAIRLLINAYNDGMAIELPRVQGLLQTHLSFSEKLPHGTWFLHDSLELPRYEAIRTGKRSKNRAFGSSFSNGLVLNTHLDTLVTAMYFLRSIPNGSTDRSLLLNAVEEGKAALNSVLSNNHALEPFFSNVDSFIRKQIFLSYTWQQTPARIFRGIVTRTYFPIRRRLISLSAKFAFPDGYLERDIGLSGVWFEYHLVNLYDLSRFIAEAKRQNKSCDEWLISRCQTLVEDGINYATNSSYFFYVTDSMKRSTRAVLLCEVIVLFLAIGNLRSVPTAWVRAYSAIRRQTPPSPALHGYDPLVVLPAVNSENRTDGEDVIRLLNGNTLVANFLTETFVILSPSCETEAKSTTHSQFANDK